MKSCSLLLALLLGFLPIVGLARAGIHFARAYAPVTQYVSHIAAEASGFEKPQLSLDGKLVGWLVDIPPCCESYSVPQELAVMDTRGQLHVFSPGQGIVGWCFSKDSRAVAFSTAAMHGPSGESFELRRVEDGELLKQFYLSWKDRDEQADGLPTKIKMPAWAVCAATYPGQRADDDASR